MADMTEQEYIANRVDDQMNWYDRKSQSSKRSYMALRTAEIICAAAIPVLTANLDVFAGEKFLVAALGAAIVALTALLSLGHHQENWTYYRSACEALKREKFRFLTDADPYNTDKKFALFVEHIEALLAKENSGWGDYIRSGAKADDKGAGATA